MSDKHITKFEHLGWFLEYLVGSKLVGTKRISEKDRDIVGMEGQQHGLATDVISLDRGKSVKKGAKYRTRLYPLCGKVIKK